MLPTDTDPSVIQPFMMVDTGVPPVAAPQIVFDGNESAGSDSYETTQGQDVIFRDDATASSATIINNGGQTLFEDRTTAASSKLTANEGGRIRFSGESTGGDDSKIIINGGGQVDFVDDSSAGRAEIANSAALRFAGRSTAANAKITVNETGTVVFDGTATAGEAEIGNSGATGFFGSSTMGKASITNNETGTVYFADDSTAGADGNIGNSGTVVFTDRSSLADSSITNNDTGLVRFEDDSTAGDGFISAGSGGLVFTDRSSAANAEIVGNEGGLILFTDDSTAANANISGGADLRFAGRSTAGASTVTMGEGTTASFTENASGGTARFQLDAGSTLDIAAAADDINVGAISGAGTVKLGANTLGVDDDLDGSFAGRIEDGGAGGGFTKRGTGILNLSGESDYSGATHVAEGTLEAGDENVFATRSAFTIDAGATLALAGFDQEIGSLAGAGAVDLATNAVLTTGGNNTSTTFSGVLSGSGGLVKTGAGALTLSGVSAYSGDTSVLAGILRVNGDISASDLSVGPAGTLAGIGRVGNTNVAGTLLGEANATPLTVEGDLTLAGTSTTVIEVAGSQAGSFDVTGTATLDGVLVVRSSGGIPAGFEHVFLTAGSVTGAYDDVQSELAFYDASVTSNATSATLLLERNDVSFEAVAATRNQRATATGIESLGDGNDVFDAILPLSVAEARAAFDNLSGEGHADVLAAMASARSGIRRTVLDKTRNVDGTGVWGDIQASTVRQSSDGNGGDTKLDTLAMVGGADLLSTKDYQLGIYGFASESDLSASDRATSGTLRSAGAGVYGAWTPDRLRVRGGADIGYDAIELERRIAVGDVTGTAASDYSGVTASAFAEVAYAAQAGTVAIEPYAGLAYTYARTNGFGETGAGGANLSSDGASHSRLDAEIGARASTRYQLENGVVIEPAIGLGYIRNLSGSVATSTHSFAGGDDFTVASARTGRDSAAIDMRIDVAFTRDIDGELFYRGLLSDADYSQLIGAGLRVAF